MRGETEPPQAEFRGLLLQQTTKRFRPREISRCDRELRRESCNEKKTRPARKERPITGTNSSSSSATRAITRNQTPCGSLLSLAKSKNNDTERRSDEYDLETPPMIFASGFKARTESKASSCGWLVLANAAGVDEREDCSDHDEDHALAARSNRRE